MRKQIQALGRLKTGQMNKTESAYCQHLELRKRAGEIAWYRFEGIKLRLTAGEFTAGISLDVDANTPYPIRSKVTG